MRYLLLILVISMFTGCTTYRETWDDKLSYLAELKVNEFKFRLNPSGDGGIYGLEDFRLAIRVTAKYVEHILDTGKYESRICVSDYLAKVAQETSHYARYDSCRMLKPILDTCDEFEDEIESGEYSRERKIDKYQDIVFFLNEVSKKL